MTSYDRGRKDALKEFIERIKPRLEWESIGDLYPLAIQHSIDIAEMMIGEEDNQEN